MAARHRLVAALVLLSLLPSPGPAVTVYRWTDTAGVTHFSDTAPPGTPAPSRATTSAPAAISAQGLRAGEQATLQAIKQRVAEQHRAERQVRQRNHRALAERRRDCRERRARQRSTGNHPARKADTIYLRRNCW